MESNVKFVQIAVTMGNDFLSPALYGIDTDGQLWRLVFGGDWVKSTMPTNRQKELYEAIESYESMKKNAMVARTIVPPVYALVCTTRIAHAAFMLHPELREE